MKIIAHIPYGYLVAMSVDEMAKIAGKPELSKHPDAYHHSERAPLLKLNTEVEVSKTWDHLQKIQQSEEARRRIAESLRAAATLVDHTPDPLNVTSSAITFPTTPTQA